MLKEIFKRLRICFLIGFCGGFVLIFTSASLVYSLTKQFAFLGTIYFSLGGAAVLFMVVFCLEIASLIIGKGY